MIEFAHCKWEEIQGHVEDHVRKHNITVESFWEDHVLKSNHYKIIADNKLAGYFAIHKESMITLFNVFHSIAGQSQEIFARVKRYEQVTNAMVATGDEFFLSHCFDSFSRIEKQAYFAIFTERDMPEEKQKDIRMRLMDIDSDEPGMFEDFLDGIIDEMRKGADYTEVYTAEHEGDVVGCGVIDYGRIIKDAASIGMYVRPEYRRRGIAANILRQMKSVANSKGCRAFAGCWYYNHNSKKSMESAGAYIKTRLMKFYF